MKEKGIVKRHKNVPEKAAVALWYFQSCLHLGEAVSQTSLSKFTGVSRGQIKYYLHPDLVGDVSFAMSEKTYRKGKCTSKGNVTLKFIRECKCYIKACNRVFNVLSQMRGAGVCSSSSDLRTLNLFLVMNEKDTSSGIIAHKAMFHLEHRRQVYSVDCSRVKAGNSIIKGIATISGNEKSLAGDIAFIMMFSAETHRIMNSLFVK